MTPNNPVEQQKLEISYDEVSDFLEELRDNWVIHKMRERVQHAYSDSFFRNYDTQEMDDEEAMKVDDMPIGEILDNYWQALSRSEDSAVSVFEDESHMLSTKKALEPGSTERRIFAAFYGFDEDTPWGLASDAFASGPSQPAINENFETYVYRTYERLQEE